LTVLSYSSFFSSSFSTYDIITLDSLSEGLYSFYTYSFAFSAILMIVVTSLGLTGTLMPKIFAQRQAVEAINLA